MCIVIMLQLNRLSLLLVIPLEAKAKLANRQVNFEGFAEQLLFPQFDIVLAMSQLPPGDRNLNLQTKCTAICYPRLSVHVIDCTDNQIFDTFLYIKYSTYCGETQNFLNSEQSTYILKTVCLGLSSLLCATLVYCSILQRVLELLGYRCRKLTLIWYRRSLFTLNNETYAERKGIQTNSIFHVAQVQCWLLLRIKSKLSILNTDFTFPHQ